MQARLRVVRAGPGATVQDRGRRGYLRYGVNECGPMDWLAHETANRALENPADAATLEIAGGGLEVVCEDAPLRVAYAGGGFTWSHNGARRPAAARLTLQPEDRLAVVAGAWGAWTYLAIAGGIDVPLVLGSRSTHTRSSMGGLAGRALEAGDTFETLPLAVAGEGSDASILAPWLERPQGAVRIVLGPQDDYFTTSALATLLGSTYTISPRFDRMGYWLDGPKLEHAHGFDIVSDGIAAGAIQVPGEGLPLILLADHQTTGGYPKIANVVRVDLGAVAQRRPGEGISFERFDVARAQRLFRARMHELDTTLGFAPLGVRPSDEALLTRNLIGGVHNPVE